MPMTRKTIRKRHDNRGFTLIEIIIGLFVFAVGVLAVVKMQTASIDANGAAKVRSQAVFLAETKMEELMREAFGALESGGPEGEFPHSVRWEVTDGDHIKEIEVTVTWNYKGEKSLTLNSIRGNL